MYRKNGVLATILPIYMGVCHFYGCHKARGRGSSVLETVSVDKRRLEEEREQRKERKGFFCEINKYLLAVRVCTL